MSASSSKRRPREPWLSVRQELSPKRRLLLMVCSFLLPIGVWCAATYLPIFQGFIKLTVTADQNPGMAVYNPGDRVAKKGKDGKPGFVDYLANVRAINDKIRADRDSGVVYASSRSNLKRMRKLEPVAESNGWLTDVDTNSTTAVDAKLFSLFGQIAEDPAVASASGLSGENIEIVKQNWSIMRMDEPFTSKTLTKTPLLQLVPQGVSSSPVFLPAPHECIQAAWRDFTTKPANNMPWMHERLFTSLKVVFGGFLLACLIGVPLSIICGTYDFAAKIVEPFTDFFRYMPAPTFGLLLQAAFGIFGAPKIALVFIGTFPHMVLMIGNTTRLLDKPLLEAAQTLGANKQSLIGRVIIPGIMPKMYNDLRVLLGWAWTWLVIAELIGEKSGLTAFIHTQGSKFNFDRVFPVIIMIGIIGFLTDQILQAIAKKLFPWEYTNVKRGFFGELFAQAGRMFRKPQAKEVAHA